MKNVLSIDNIKNNPRNIIYYFIENKKEKNT